MKKYTILLALVVLMGACKKDDDNTPSPNGGTSILTTGSWKLTASTSVIDYPAPIGTQTGDLYALMQDCEKDNTAKYNTDYTITIDEGATKCDPSAPQTTTQGTWALSNNNTQFTFSYQGTVLSGTILTLTNTTMTIRYVTTYNGINSTTTSTYAHI